MNIPQEIPPRPSSLGKLLLSFGFMVISFVYVLRQHSGASVVMTPSLSSSQTSSGALTPSESYRAANEALLKTLAQIAETTAPTQPTATPPAAQTAPAKTSTTQPMMTPMMKPAGKYADGSYTGSAADAYYGTVQVKAVVRNGQLADVQFLQYPNDRSNSRYINSQAMPLLTQEAIQAQSAQVDGVSGATFTSQAFQQSLTAALALAKN